MIITVSHKEYTYNRASRKKESREVIDGNAVVPDKVTEAVKRLAPEYKMSVAEMVVLALQYYFGDGADHLKCEDCAWYWGEKCIAPELVDESTVPILDKGTVVVGLSTSEQVF